MKAFFYFARLHALRAYRLTHELGFVRTLFVLLLLFMAVQLMRQQFASGNYWLGLILIPIFQGVQVKRKDQNLLKLLGVSGYWLYTGFFLILSSPVLVGLSLGLKWTYVLFLIAFCFLIPLTRSYMFNPDRLFVNIGGFLPFKYFEWRAGLRQYGLAVCALLLIGIGLSFFVATVPLVIFFLTINTSVFYLNGESKELLCATSSSPKNLIWSKVKAHLTLSGIMLTPISILFLVFHSEYWFVLLAVLTIALIVNINAIIFKYASYQPGQSFESNSVLQGISMASFLVPFLAPLPIVLSFINYKKALNRLAVYY